MSFPPLINGVMHRLAFGFNGMLANGTWKSFHIIVVFLLVSSSRGAQAIIQGLAEDICPIVRLDPRG